MNMRQAQKVGSVFQITMVMTYIGMLIYYLVIQGGLYDQWFWPSSPGMALFAYCLYRLYPRPGARVGHLITTGPFRYTRHPMYTGLAIMDLIFWLPEPVSLGWDFFFLQGIFFGCLITAAWYQEKETIARFGNAAVAYYARTPRLFLTYPFRHVGSHTGRR